MEHQFFSSLFPFLLLIISVIIWKIFASKNFKPRAKLPPGPSKLPLLGNLHLFVGTLPHRRLSDLAKKHGPIMHVQLGEISTVVVSSPAVAELVTRTHDISFCNKPNSVASSILCYNSSDIAFAPYGEYWRQLRKLCTVELFSLKRVQSFRAIREEEVSDFVRKIGSEAGSSVNLRKRLCSLTYGIISRAAFGAKYEEHDDFLLVVHEFLDAMAGFSLVDVFPSLKLLHLMSGGSSKLKKVHQKLDKIIQSVIDEHRARKTTPRSCKEEEEEEVKDLLDVFLNLQENGDLGFPLTDASIKAVFLVNMVTLIIIELHKTFL